MMKKTGAGLLRSGAGVFLLGVCWGVGGMEAPGQEISAAPAPVDFKAKVQARVNALKNLPVEEIEKSVLRSELDMLKLNEEAQAARVAVRDLQEKMRAENPDVQAKYREIDEMRAKINVFIDELPEVKTQLDTVKQAEAKLMEEVWFRTGAMGLVAEKDRAAGFPERPETVLDESETNAVPEPTKDLEP